ncbi:septum formation inhibitor Maf [Egibacter rhizosphaerae]|uniref:dTTP/UTP pyrophosphatase n=1 Tax=Egibacter rhizosphaerae TaxID=1670831 RepID=A0A411YCX8_9ACTN|nr:Maf family protein [Egibacter rhizosphaerae]QBI19074.1 septum formation inhibitor Maf [Egibacter rhizosphaerae]
MGETPFVLASASPRRRELLALADLPVEVRAPEVDETPEPNETPHAYVARLARTKASACVRGPGEVVLAADTAVVLDGAPLGKPRDPEHAAALLGALSGRRHTVLTGVAVAGGRLPEVHAEVVATEVEFAHLTAEMIAWYVATGEPFDKAGGYGIQGRAALFVRRIEGSWTNVVGLPLVESLELLRAAGVRV